MTHSGGPAPWRLRTILAVALIAGSAGAAAAQVPFGVGPRSFLGAAGLGALPVGAFDDHVDTGYGIGAAFMYVPVRSGWLGIRLDAGYLRYGNDTVGDCPDTPFECTTVQRSVSNDILYGGVGPQVMLPGGPVRPYAAAGVGVSYFASTFSEAVPGAEPSTESLAEDPAFRWSGAAGLYVMLPTSFPIAIDLGARFHRNGVVEYLPELELDPDLGGVPDASTVTGEADYITLRIGLMIGIPGRQRL